MGAAGAMGNLAGMGANGVNGTAGSGKGSAFSKPTNIMYGSQMGTSGAPNTPTQQPQVQLPAGQPNPMVQQPLDVFHRPPTQPGFMTQPPAGGLGSLQQFNPQGGFGGFGQQYGGGFGQNPQMQQYRQQMEAWHNQRPDFGPGMDRDMRHQQMEAWRDQRPDRPGMQQGFQSPFSLSDGPNMPHGVGEPMPPQQNAQLAPFVSTYNQLQNSAGNQAQQAQLLSQYNQMLQSVGMPTMSMGGPGITPDAVAQKLGTGAPSGATPVAGQQAALQNAYQDFLQQKQLGSAAPAGAPPAPMQAVMPPAPNTQQIGREDPRMQAMRAMQMFANQRRGG